MKKKSFVCFALTAVMALSAAMLSACGKEKEPEVPPAATGPVYATEFPGALYENGVPSQEGKGMIGAHDPTIVEAKNDGKSVYYSFGTDNYASGYGVPIRKSSNLYTWEWVGTAIRGYNNTKSENVVKEIYESSTAELKPVYDIVSSYNDWARVWTLWAPDVVPATSNTNKDVNGEWWLYSSWTAKFGSQHSVIFMCKSVGIEGPYEYVDIIVQNNSSNFNEIDPSVYYTDDGKMFMSYGSFAGGFATIELNPATGLRKEGPTTDPGKTLLKTGSAEGSAINRHTVSVYTGDIATEDYDESKWDTQTKYYMMGSWGDLKTNYNMRVWTSDDPDKDFTSERGASGLQVSGTWTWRKATESSSNYKDKDLNFYIPGHNDMLTTSDGVNVIAYHVRVAEMQGGYAEGEHFLYTSMYDFNSKGQLVINPNRYVGEKIGPVTAEDLLSTKEGTKTAGLYSAITFSSTNAGGKTPIAYPEDCTLNADGTLTLGSKTGAWKVYGDHYIYIELDGLHYYGSVMPAQIRQYDGLFGFIANNGLTISAISDVVGGENKVLYMNMQFSA